MTIGAVDTGLNRPLALDTRGCDLTGVSYKLVSLFFTNREVNLLNTRFIRVSQWILWQSICFWCITWYHVRLSSTNFYNLRYWSKSFLVRKLLAVDFLSVGTIDSSLNRTLALDTRSRNLASISDKLVRLFFTNCEVDFFNSSFVRISQSVLWQSIYFWRIVRYHAWLSRSDFNNLCYWS